MKQSAQKLTLVIGTAAAALAVSAFLYFVLCWISAPFYSLAGVPILNYHQVNDVNYSPLTMQVAHFRKQMEYLKASGYHTITMDQLYDHLENGAELPPKPVLITFDDGYTDNFTNAYPILKKYHMRATIFMIGDAIGEPRFLTLEQLRELQAGGIDIESHTMSHKSLITLTPDQVRNEMVTSRAYLSKVLGREVNYIAYPGGFSNDLIDREARAAGYKMAVTVKPGNAVSAEEMYSLPRLAVFEGDNAYVSLIVRLHFARFTGYMWSLRDHLRDKGYTGLASLVPLP